MKNKFILIDFDETLTTWDSGEYIYRPRPYMYLLLSYLTTYADIYIDYKGHNKYLVDVFKERFLYNYKEDKVMLGKPDISPDSDYLHITSAYCIQCPSSRYSSRSVLYIAPSFLTFGKDLELLLVKNYLQHKLNIDEPFKGIDYSDWHIRIQRDYNLSRTCSHYCNKKGA